jgi:hypothetical protein
LMTSRPSCLSIDKGAIDYDDPPLHVSRKTLQQHKLLKVRGEHHETEEVESKPKAYVIEGDIILVSRPILEALGCTPKTFPQVGQFLTNDDDAFTRRAVAINQDPIGPMSDGTKAPDMPEATARYVDKPKSVEPCAKAVKASMASNNASKMAGTRTDPPEVAIEMSKKISEDKYGAFWAEYSTNIKLGAIEDTAIAEEEDAGDSQDDGVRDDQDQKFTLPIHETTNTVFTACLIKKAVEESSLVEDYMGGKEGHGSR